MDSIQSSSNLRPHWRSQLGKNPFYSELKSYATLTGAKAVPWLHQYFWTCGADIHCGGRRASLLPPKTFFLARSLASLLLRLILGYGKGLVGFVRHAPNLASGQVNKKLRENLLQCTKKQKCTLARCGTVESQHWIFAPNNTWYEWPLRDDRSEARLFTELWRRLPTSAHLRIPEYPATNQAFVVSDPILRPAPQSTPATECFRIGLSFSSLKLKYLQKRCEKYKVNDQWGLRNWACISPTTCLFSNS